MDELINIAIKALMKYLLICSGLLAAFYPVVKPFQSVSYEGQSVMQIVHNEQFKSAQAESRYEMKNLFTNAKAHASEYIEKAIAENK